MRPQWILFASLVAAGATLGAVAGVVVIVLLAAVVARSSPGSFDVLMAAMWGAVLGAVLGPATLYTVLRHAPVGRAMRVTFLGTLLGAVAGVLVAMPQVGAPLGFLAAVAWLKRRYPATEATRSPRDFV